MKKILTLTASALSFLSLATVSALEEGWTNDFEAAKKTATDEEKDLLLNFTGSDWCGWCVKLKDEVFSQESFKKEVRDQFVLVELDYPKTVEGLAKLSNETQGQNQKLQQIYQIQGFPSIVLTDSRGRPYGRTGYRQGGSEKYLQHLEDLRAIRKKRDAAFAEAEEKAGSAKALTLFGGLQEIPKAYWKFYPDVIETIKANDPDDVTGLKAEQKMEGDLLELEKRLQFAMKNRQPDRALALIDEFLGEQELEGEKKQKLLATKLNILNAMRDYTRMEKVIEEIIAVDPDSAYAKQLAGFKNTKLQELKKEASEKE